MATDRGRIRKAVVVGESAGVNLFVFGVCVPYIFCLLYTSASVKDFGLDAY